MKALDNRWKCLARNGSSKVVDAETNVGRVDKTGSSSGNGMGESSIGSGIWVSGIQNLGISLGFTLAIVSMSVVSMSIGSKSLGGCVKSLGDWVKTSAGAEWDTVVSSIEKLGISLGITLAIVAVVGNIASSTWDRGVQGVHAGSTLQTNNAMGMGIGIAEELGLSRDGSHKGRCYNLEQNNTLKIFEKLCQSSPKIAW